VATLPGGYTPELWGYEDRDPADVHPFGDETTYVMGLGWLYRECETVQDWGAGPAYGRRFCPEGKSYFAVDGSPTSEPFVDLVCELSAWRPDPKPDGIFMRHILEHNNTGWKDLLAHALDSCTKRFCLVIFTPFTGAATRPMRPAGDRYWDLTFNFAELTQQFGDRRWRTEALPTGTQYGSETLFYIEQPA
jgi:hypothetical protein